MTQVDVGWLGMLERHGRQLTNKLVTRRHAVQEALEKHRQHVVGRNDRQSYANDLERERLARQDDRQRRNYLVRARTQCTRVGSAPSRALNRPCYGQDAMGAPLARQKRVFTTCGSQRL